MRKQDAFDVIYTHTEGEPLCIVHSGIPYPAGSTILESAPSWNSAMTGCARR